MLGFYPRDETAMLVYKTIENCSTSSCIIIESNSQETFYSIVLYTNMAAVTSDEKVKTCFHISKCPWTLGAWNNKTETTQTHTKMLTLGLNII